ncbi:MAG: hypothetical protein ABW000_15615 [Actinoplanes sp.]
MRLDPRENPSWFAQGDRIPQPRRPSPGPSRRAEWAAARCDEIVGGIRGGLWRFTEGVADVLHPGLGPAVTAAQRVTKWGPALVGLNDERGAEVKIGLIGSENLGLWMVLRTSLGQIDPGPRPSWCVDLPLESKQGDEGVQEDATVISGIEEVKADDVALLLAAPPMPGAATRLLARVDVRRRAGIVAVDAGDGHWQRRIFFTIVYPATRGDGHHETFRVVCPTCDRRRLAQFRGFDVCSDCGWVQTA